VSTGSTALSTLLLDRVATVDKPEAFGNYRLLGRLASGGMAEVFVARFGAKEKWHNVVALKRILPHIAQDEGFVSLFQREAQISLRLAHPGIIRVFEVGEVEGRWFMAMELVQGEPLSRVLNAVAGRGLPVPIACHIIADVAEALHYIHTLQDEHGTDLQIVHRDISPQNILVGFDGNAEIIDFGIARAEEFGNLTRTGTMREKVGYFSPEQAEGAQLDGRSDVFALAAVLYECLTGEGLFLRDSEVATIRALMNLHVPVLAGVGPQLNAALKKALAVRPKDRFANALEFARALRTTVPKGLNIYNKRCSYQRRR
jgi:eukaryotic-like serine/threonine-protein kinase